MAGAPIPVCTTDPIDLDWRTLVTWDHSWDAADYGASTYEGTGVDFPDEGTRFASIPDRGTDTDLRALRRDDGTYGAVLGLPGPIPGMLRTSGPWFGGRTLALADDAKSASGATALFSSLDAGATDPFTEDALPMWGAAVIVPDNTGVIDSWWSPALIGGTGVVTIQEDTGFWRIALTAVDGVTTAIPYVNGEPVLIIWHVDLGVNLSFLEINGVREYVTLTTNTPVLTYLWGFFGRGYWAMSGMKEGEPTDRDVALVHCFYDGLVDGTACGFYDDFETYADGTNPPFPPYELGAGSPNEFLVQAGQLVPPEYTPGLYNTASVAFGALDQDCQTIHVRGEIAVVGGSSGPQATAAITLFTSLGNIICIAGAGSGANLTIQVDDGGGPVQYSTPLAGFAVGTSYDLYLSYCESTGAIVARVLWGSAEDAWVTATPTLCGTPESFNVFQSYYTVEGTGEIDSFEITCEAIVEPV